MSCRFARILVGMLACLFIQVWPLAGVSLVQAQPHHHHSMQVCAQPMQAECAQSPATMPGPAPHGPEKCCTADSGVTQTTSPTPVFLPAAPLGAVGLRAIPRTVAALVGTTCLPARRPPKIQAA